MNHNRDDIMRMARQAALLLCVTGVILCSWLAPLDSPATEQVDAGLKSALVTFATARTLNGMVSAIQGTQIATQPFGIGITLTPGQLFAPINELLKHFADVMLAASIAFGIQRVLLAIAGNWVVSMTLSAAAVGWAWYMVRRERAPGWLARGLVVLLMVRFAVPVATIGTDLLAQKFLAADYKASHQAVELSSTQLSTLSPPAPTSAEPSGMLDRLKELIPKGSDAKARFQQMQDVAEQTTNHVVKIMAIFLLQTMILPLLLLWGLYGIARLALIPVRDHSPAMIDR
jgi:hypothetical protein